MKIVFLIAISLLSIFLSLFIGVYGFDLQGLSDIHSTLWSLLIYERIPRTLGAFGAGAALGLSSAIFSSIFRNQLASPYTLGISSAAGFGAALALYFEASIFVLAASALSFGLLAIFMAFALAARARFSELALLLCGLLVGSLFTSLIAVLKYSADPLEKLPTMVFFLMGQASLISLEQIYFLLPLLAVVFLASIKISKSIDILSLGAVQARAFGVGSYQRLLAILLACLAAAISVGLCGIVGWVGISAGFFARLLVGPSAKILLPSASVIGGVYLLAMDDLIRSSASLSLPLGALCGLFSLPILFILIATKRITL